MTDVEDRIADLEEALWQIRHWCDAYPIDVFTEPTKDEIDASVTALRGPGRASSEQMHGSWARRILKGVRGLTDILTEDTCAQKSGIGPGPAG